MIKNRLFRVDEHIARCFSRVSDYQSVSQSFVQIVEKSSDGGKNWAPLRYFRIGISILPMYFSCVALLSRSVFGILLSKYFSWPFFSEKNH